ncbi:hypothetical protein E1287_39260 [Actinomadura sp. KC06]|uniref:hypothetical protein n=1 Tax=Actinomadura sp. KC06 TaxID=2530369 RepID=UPI0010467C9E|nr:hypothetical protein [Actinomadura sp. KC06]TDD23159.1 hypothetical protein E1287_39260 [Actinomadura sp. KC06]
MAEQPSGTANQSMPGRLVEVAVGHHAMTRSLTKTGRAWYPRSEKFERRDLPRSRPVPGGRVVDVARTFG